MRKIFFCAKNLDDYRRTFADIVVIESIFDMSGVRTQEEYDQKFFSTYIPALYKLPKNFFDEPLAMDTDVDGLRMDFNFGLRLDVPHGNFHVIIGDFDSGEIFFDADISDARLISVEQFFIRWHVEVFLDGRKIFQHTLDLQGQPVLISFDKKNALGDLIALLPYVREFKRRHGCELSIFLPEHMRELAANLYPEIPQVSEVTSENYATYYPVMSMAACPILPVDIRNMTMEMAGGRILGLETLPTKPTFTPTTPRFFSEPYVCIGVQASSTRKGWHWPGGWDIVVDFLKSLGYRVFCIDKNAQESGDGYTIRMPAGTEDFTGDFSIIDRANMLYHAEFFIGLSSGLAWIAHTVGCPVVMICGFSEEWFEFYTPYRVANRLVCNGCLNDLRLNFKGPVCPLHHGTSRELECQKKISPRQVLNAIERLILDHATN
ncbi:MAG: autotransporter strand-loop-strand O-heptosyltransferase [Selenomonadaceae bacterium]|nr:autotransporter strand-loop-strand O-heptosyltransferase [Selenomonadaceae bacterium]